MELTLELKICEGCGCLWFRVRNQETVYCRECEIRLSEFPAPTKQRRRRAPRFNPPLRLRPAASTAGGGQ
jgi:hypothetical protein